MVDMYPGTIESICTGMVSLLTTELQNNVTAAFKVRVGYPHDTAQIPLSAWLNIIDVGSEEFGQGQKYGNNKIQIRKALSRISIYVPKTVDTTTYKDGAVGSSGSTEQQYLDRIADRIQRTLITYRDLNMNRVCDCRLRSISPLIFDENLNAYNKTLSFEIEYEEII